MKFLNLPLASLALFASVRAFAESTTNDLLDLSLEDLMQVKIVSSTLTEKSLRTVPSSVSVFAREQISAMGIDYLDELLNFVPGFQAFRQADSGGEYYHSSRGIRSGTSSREVLILIDGNRVNAEFAGGSVHMIALGNIEKIEIIRGPGSAIYGSNAFVGVINITTSNNKNMWSQSFGSSNRIQTQLFKTASLNDVKVDLFANAYRDRGQSYTVENFATHNPYQTRDPIDGYDINVKIGKDKHQLNLTYFARNAYDFLASERVGNDVNETKVTDTSISFKQVFDWSDSINTDYNLRYHHRTSFIQFQLIPPAVDATFEEASFEFALHNNWMINESRSLQFGLEDRHIDNEKVTLHTAFGPALINRDYERDVLGIYVQHQNNITDKTELTLGARYDNYSQVGSAFSPRLGFIHQLSDVQTIKLLYGKAFRAPGIGDLTLTSNNSLIGNPDLKPEKIATWELVWMGSWKSSSLTITGFENKINDSIVQGFGEDGTTRMYVNAPESQDSRGLEFELMKQLNSHWQVRAQYSVFNTLPSTAFRQADNIASAIVQYEENNWVLNLSANYAGERKMMVGNALVGLDKYWLVNGKLQYSLRDNSKLYLQIKNMADEDYLTPSQGSILTQGAPNRGREFSVGFDWRF
jgi:iron complex outermembrane receptor protein